MRCKTEYARKKNGITACLMVTIVTSLLAKEPTPWYNLNLVQVGPPRAPKLTIKSVPTQQALINTPFYYPLTSLVAESEAEISYQLTDFSRNLNRDTTGISSVIRNIEGLPAGVAQVVLKPSDCPVGALLTEKQTCRLRFYVYPSAYRSNPAGNGPVLVSDVRWFWGTHYKHIGGEVLRIPISNGQPIAHALASLKEPPQLKITPTEQHGLYFDPQTSSITGTPTRTGDYEFSIRVYDQNADSISQRLIIQVNFNPQEKPVFKQKQIIPKAMPDSNYQLNLMSLIESYPNVDISNYIRFRIDTNNYYPFWLSLNDNGIVLQGHVPPEAAGFIETVTLIATSNAGGESSPLTIEIPVAYPQNNPQNASSTGRLI
jgi:hypothetical protein